MSLARLDEGELRHLLRRCGLAVSAGQVAAMSGLSAADAFERLRAQPGEAVESPLPWRAEPWRNDALRFAGVTDEAFTHVATRDREHFEAQREQLQQWWLQRMVRGNPLRERLALFLQSHLGSSSTAVGIAPALGLRVQLLRHHALGSYPALLRALVSDPATMIQIGMDGHDIDRVSDRPAKLVLERWTVGAGAYTGRDLEEVSRALTGWRLEASDGWQPPHALDPQAPLAARRTGIQPRFDPARHDGDAKTLFGRTGNFDAATAIDVLALQPATARRLASALARELGVVDAPESLLRELEQHYIASNGDLPGMVRLVVLSEAFWSPASRWSQIKSPVQLAVGACQQLQIHSPSLPPLSAWLTATGQSLFDTAENGEKPWPGEGAWLEPPDRLALRYQLPAVLAGASLALGMQPRPASSRPLPLSAALAAHTDAAGWLRLLDAAPGLEPAMQSRGRIARTDVPGLASSIIASAQYQIA